MMNSVVDPSAVLGMRAVRAAPALQTLLNLARSESGFPGRKTLVYFSEGLQMTEGQRQQFWSIIEAANRANLTTYPIDVSGLDYQVSSSTFANEMPLPSIGRVGLNPMTARTGNINYSPDISIAQNSRARDLRMMESMDLNPGGSRTGLRGPLSELAVSTGGFLVFNTNDVRKQTRRIAEEALAYYEVTYVPAPAPLDGRFRRVSVTVDRPKVTAQTRDGYIAVPKVPGAPMQPFEVPLFNELAKQPGRYDFEHRTAVVPLRPVRDRVETAILIESSLGALQVQEDPAAGLLRMHGAALAVVRDSRGKIVERFARDDPFQAPQNRRDRLLKTLWPMEVRAELPPGTYTFETIMADKQADHASVRRTQFVVEPWKPGPHVSGLAFVRSTRCRVRRRSQGRDAARIHARRGSHPRRRLRTEGEGRSGRA
jgi:hypothetical protein